MTIIKLPKVKWAPYSKYGYASGRMMTICFDTKEECDEWVTLANNAYPKYLQYRVKYVSLPYLTGNDLLNAEIDITEDKK